MLEPHGVHDVQTRASLAVQACIPKLSEELAYACPWILPVRTNRRRVVRSCFQCKCHVYVSRRIPAIGGAITLAVVLF